MTPPTNQRPQPQAVQAGAWQFLETILISGGCAGLLAAAPLFQGQNINWYAAGAYFLLAFVSSIVHALLTYAKTMPSPEQNSISALVDAFTPVFDELVSTFQKRLPAQSPAPPVGVGSDPEATLPKIAVP